MPPETVSVLTPRQYARDLAKAAEPERVRRAAERLTLELSQPIVPGFRRKTRRQAAVLPLFDPKQEGLF